MKRYRSFLQKRPTLEENLITTTSYCTKKKKKIGIASCYYQDNYGSILQAFATQQVICKLGYDNETISVNGIKRIIDFKKKKYFAIKAITSLMGLEKIGIFLNRIRIVLFRNEYEKSISCRRTVLDGFRRSKIILSRNMNSFEELINYSKEAYSCIVVGSDQLWLPGNIVGGYFTLEWVPDNIRRISYSTSFGQKKLPFFVSVKAKRFLSMIDYLSVREQDGAKIVKSLIGKTPIVVVDPVMLYGANEWGKLVSKKNNDSSHYIFCYFLGRNKKERQFAVSLKKKTNYKIIALPNLDEYVKVDNSYADYTLYDIDPIDFVSLIYNADIVCTDSFHCSAFCILFNKNFHAFRRYKRENIYSTNNRMYNLLEESGIEEYHIKKDNQDGLVFSSDSITSWDMINKCVNTKRKASIDYLKTAFSGLD